MPTDHGPKTSDYVDRQIRQEPHLLRPMNHAQRDARRDELRVASPTLKDGDLSSKGASLNGEVPSYSKSMSPRETQVRDHFEHDWS